VPELSPIQRDLQVLEVELRKLETEYNMYFAGRLPRPPWETRGRVEALIKRWDRAHIDSAVDRFRFSTLQARFNAFADLWDRGLRAREEGRPGPFSWTRKETEPSPTPTPPADRVLFVTSFSDPRRELDKLQSLYESVMDARRAAGEPVVPFHKFADLVRDQITRLKARGSREVAFRVALRDGRVNLTVRGLKGPKKGPASST
jgi:hypothetical protein